MGAELRTLPFNSMVARIQEIDNEKASAKRHTPRHGYLAGYSAPNSSAQNSHAQTLHPVAPVPVPTPTTGGEPMDLSAIGTRPVPSKPRHITQEQYQQRLQTGVCINCGAASHRRSQCPQRHNNGSFIKLNTTGVEENQHTTSNEEN